MKKNFILLLLLLYGLIYSGCIKEWTQFVNEDLNNVTVDSINVNPGLAVHVGKATFKIGDLIKEKPDTLVFDEQNDSLIKFILQMDTLYKMAVSDVYTMPTMDPISGMNFNMGDMTLAPLSTSKNVLLKSMINSTGVTYPGTGTVFFPAINGLAAGEYAYQSFDSFQEATFKSGQFSVTVTNNTPLVITIILALKNSDGTYFGNDVTFTDMQPNQTYKQIVDAATPGKNRMTAIVTGEVKSFSTPGSLSVTLSDTDALKFAVKTEKDLVIESAIAKVPYTEFSSDTSVNITPADNPTMDIKTLKLKSGKITFGINGTFPAPIQMEISMPFTKDVSGNALKQTLTIGGANSNASLDLSNTTTDLTQNGTTKNSFSLQYRAFTSDTTNMYTFTPPANFTLDASFDNFDFDYIEGSLGNFDSVAIPSDTMDLGIGDLFNKLEGSIKLTNPKITLGVQNSFGFGADLKLHITGKKGSDSVQVNINQSIQGATNPGDDVFSTVVLDKTTDNGKLIDLIALPPEQILFGGDVAITGKKSSNLFVAGASRILTNLDINIPLELNLNNVAFTDTMNLDSTTVPKELTGASLILNSTNGFPMSVGLQLDLFDSISNTKIETLTFKNTNGENVLLAAAKLNTDGTITPSENKIIMNLSNSDFENLQKANQLIFKLFLSTDDAVSGNGVPFRANSKISLDVSVAATSNVTINN